MKNRRDNLCLIFIALLVLILSGACSSGGGGGDSSGGVDNGGGTPTISIAEIFVEASPSAINVNQQSAITAAVYDEGGSPISGQAVVFSIDRPSLAAISPSIATTDGNGVASATLTARDLQGELVISATAGEVSSNDRAVSILSGVSPDTINVTANPATVLVEGTAAIMAEVLDQNGNPVPDGTSVAFEVTNATFGAMFPATKTTINGFASATFTALNQPGTVTVEVSVGNLNNSVDVLVNQSQPASLEFYSAEPQRITIAGSAGIETSEVQFRVIDENGNPVSGIEVTVNIEQGPEGGEYIDIDDTPKTITVSSDSEGLARVILRAGTTAGPVTLKGTIVVGGVTYTANASVVSIGGGVPVASRFSISATPRNVPGLYWNGVESDITAWMSDRYGNYNVLAGTTVSFWSEAALAVDAATATVNADGVATVVARTQHPVLSVNTGGQNVAPWPWETDLLNYVKTTFGWAGTTTPRDGWASVGVYCQGEEHFDDLNADGAYNNNEPFEDTHDDPFLDYNDNGTYDDQTSVDPTEIFTDVNGIPGWDSYNGRWDDQKDIFASTKLLVTGPPHIIIVPDPNASTYNQIIDNNGNIVIPNDVTGYFLILIADDNLNPMAADTTVKVAFEVDIENGDKLRGYSGLEENKYFDTVAFPGYDASYLSQLGLIQFRFAIYDKAPDVDTIYAPIKVTVTVNWEGIVRTGEYSSTIAFAAY